MPKIYKFKDISDKFTIKKKDIPDVRNALAIVGRTGFGKSTILANLLLLDEYYKNDYDPKNIFIFSGSLEGDIKLKTIIDTLEIPQSNLFDSWSEEVGHTIYNMLVDEFNIAIDEKKKPMHSLWILDDLGFTNLLKVANKKNSILDKLMSNSRKYNMSIWLLLQKWSTLNTNARENLTGAILGNCSNKQLELIETDLNYITSNKKNPKKLFHSLFRRNTQDRDFLVVDFSKKNIYRNKEFKPICMCEDDSNKCGGIKQK